MLTKQMYEYMLQSLVYLAADEYGNDEKEIDNLGDMHEKLWLALSPEERDNCNDLLKQYKKGEKREFILSIINKIMFFNKNI